MPTAGAMTAGSAGRRLRVCHLLHSVAYGGVETLVIDWARSLAAARVDVMVVCFTNPGQTERPFLDAAARAGIAVQTVPWGRDKPAIRSARALVRLLRAFEAEIVHTHNVYAELVGWMAARRVGAKVITTEYVWSDFGWKRNVQQWFSARLLRRFDCVTSQCETTLRDTIARGVPRDIQCVLTSGIEPIRERPDAAARTAIRARYDCDDDDVVLANVARLYPEKAQDLLLDWFAAIVRERPRAKLWILGVGPLEATLRQRAAALGLGDRVTFLGFVVDLNPTLMAVDIQVHTSHAEGVPLAICTGMAAGMPIVATAVGGIPEIIGHDRTGLLVRVGDGTGFVRETLRLIDDVPLRARLGAAARHAVDTELSLASAAGRLASIYQRLAA